MEAARGNRLEALYVLAVNTGAAGQVGLQWRDVNLDSGTLRVNRTIFGEVVSLLPNDQEQEEHKDVGSALVALGKHPKTVSGSSRPHQTP